MQQLILTLAIFCATAIAARKPIKCELEGVEPIPGSVFGSRVGSVELSSFRCKGGNDVHLMVHKKDDPAQPVWQLKGAGRPTKVIWMDFNRDADPDLLLLYSSPPKMDLQVLHKDDFASVLRLSGTVGALVDVAHDDTPEILLKPTAPYLCDAMTLSESFRDQVQSKYQLLAGKFSASQPDEDKEPVRALGLFEKVSFYGYRKKSHMPSDLTGSFQDHIAWRANLLEKILRKRNEMGWKTGVDEKTKNECFEQIEATMKYWKSKVHVRKAGGRRRHKRRH